MKTFVKYLGTLSIILICLALVAESVTAIELSKNVAPYGGSQGMYPSNSASGPVGLSQYPSATAYCTRWIPGHWVQVKVMVPGRWIYRPVWIPARPVSQYRWVAGFWQTTGYHPNRPDVYVWGTPNGGWYGMPYQAYQNSGGGYFGPGGVWMPKAMPKTTEKK
jgi:hypothetical protein